MAKIDLTKYGITGTTEVVYNPSYDELFREETKSCLTGFDKGVLTEMDAVNVMTGVYTGRSPKDKFFVMDETSKDTIWWTSEEYKNDNKPVTEAAWAELKKLASTELSNKKLYVVDTFCGANENSRLKIRFIMEVAWQAHFVKNMFIRPTDAELEVYGEPDFVVLNASKAKVENYKELGLNSETAVVFNLTEKMQVIINTWYGGEMKKGMFSYMNYLLPLKGMASMHCSANTNEKGETAIFFGLSGTGKTTLSTDPKRQLIGDDEHGWDDEGVFNFEGGCYAKVINLSKENEPDIWNAIRRNALLENVTVDEATGANATKIALPEGFVAGGVHADDAGNLLVSGEDRAPGAGQLQLFKVNADGTYAPLVDYNSANYWCTEMGNFRVKGDVTKNALIIAYICVGTGHYAAWEVKGGVVAESPVYGNLHDGSWDASTGVVAPAGVALADGLYAITYGSTYNLNYFDGSAWAEIWVSGSSWMENYNCIATAELGGKKYLALTASSHFSYDMTDLIVLDVTDRSAVKKVYSIEMQAHTQTTEIDPSTSGHGLTYSDVALVVENGGLAIYVVDSWMDTVEKYLFPLE